MQRNAIWFVDQLSIWIGKTFAWCIVILTAAICYEIGARKFFNAPTTWAYDVSYILYGVLFMTAGAYTMSRNGHVRGDFLYRQWPPTRQAKFDLVLYFLFFFPGILALVYAGWDFFALSLLLNEKSAYSPQGPIIWPFKFFIPFVGVVMAVQGVAEVARCIICIRTGAWPARQQDVEETEKEALDRGAAALTEERKGARA